MWGIITNKDWPSKTWIVWVDFTMDLYSVYVCGDKECGISFYQGRWMFQPGDTLEII